MKEGLLLGGGMSGRKSSSFEIRLFVIACGSGFPLALVPEF